MALALRLLPFGLPAGLWIGAARNLASGLLRYRTRPVHGKVRERAEAIAIPLASEPVVEKKALGAASLDSDEKPAQFVVQDVIGAISRRQGLDSTLGQLWH